MTNSKWNRKIQVRRASARRVALFAGVLLSAVATVADAQSTWTLDVSGVWSGGKRVKFNPATGAIGNMGNAGVTYSIGPAPMNAQVAARAGASSGFDAWNEFAAVPSVRINYVLKGAGPKINIPVTWGVVAGAPGEATGAAPGYNPDPIILNSAVTLRTDGWNLNYTGNAKAGLISEYDVFTTAVHESGHTLGLGHPQSVVQVMTPQDTARTTAGGSWQAVAQTTPFAGQPMTITGAVQPNGSLDYRNPRQSFGFGDALGAITLYSAPIAKFFSKLTALGGGRADYSYTVDNLSAQGAVGGEAVRSAYDVREVDIPVPFSLPVSDLVAPTDWTLTRTSNDVVATYVGAGPGLLPGQELNFSFDSVDHSSLTLPGAFWGLEGFGPCAPESDDSRGCATPEFDPTHFGVNGGDYTYTFDAADDAWKIVPFDLVLTPVPEPGTWAMMIVGFALTGLLLRRRVVSA